MPIGPFFEQYQHMPRVRRLTEGLSSVQRSILLETTPLFANGYTSSPFSYSRADVLMALCRPQGDNDLVTTLTMSLKAHPFCFYCGKTGECARALKTCGRCKTAQYCSVSCQKKDWALSNGGGQHKAICNDLYEDLLTRSAVSDVGRIRVAEGSLEHIKGKFDTEDAERFNEKFGFWREMAGELIHLICSACLDKASKFNIDPVTVLELTTTRFLMEEVPGRTRNENVFRIIYVDQVSTDFLVTRADILHGSMKERIDIFQHEIAKTGQTQLATTSDNLLEAHAPGVGGHSMQFFFAGKPLEYSSTITCNIDNVLKSRIYSFPDRVLTLDKLIGICNRGTLVLLKTLPAVLTTMDHN